MKNIFTLLFLLGAVLLASAQNSGFINQNVEILLENGSTVTGKLTNETIDYYFIKRFENSNEIKINKKNVIEIKQVGQAKIQEYQPQNTFNTKEQDNPRHITIGLGYGNSYGGLGGSLQFKYGNLAIHGGAGYFPASFISGYDIGGEVLWSGGLKLYLGEAKKLYLDAQYGAFGVQSYDEEYYYNGYYDYYSQHLVMQGPSVLTGVDIFFNKLIGINGAIGISYLTNAIDQDILDMPVVWLAVDLGVLIKF
jgi:hypothetical protein